MVSPTDTDKLCQVSKSQIQFAAGSDVVKIDRTGKEIQLAEMREGKRLTLKKTL